MKKYRVWAEVDLKAVEENLRLVKNEVGPEVRILVVVKADAYGHGAVPVAKTALESGASMVGVGDSTEALELRHAGIRHPILILGALIEEELGWVVSFDITPTIHAAEMVGLLEQEAARQSKRQRVHVKVDTGMGRLGASPARAAEIVRRVSAAPHLELEGISTHFSSVWGADPERTEKQVGRFNALLSEVEGQGIRVKYRHAANSASLFKNPASRFNLVRPGGVIYGIDTSNLRGAGVPLRPALALKSQIAFLKGVPAGTPIGYNATHVTTRRTRIATIPVGYSDGYPYSLGNRGQVLVRGRLAPVVGTITMDYVMVDVGQVPDVRAGDEVVLIGRQGDSELRIEDLARVADTIPYEITCSLGKRVRRVYL
ncbi:MAG: alanine racemase [Planctomycetes bacterium]|nr:alanine racemase [Planctomycetota bacterium]